MDDLALPDVSLVKSLSKYRGIYCGVDFIKFKKFGLLLTKSVLNDNNHFHVE